MWILPTLNRVKKLNDFLSSAISAKTNTPGLVVVDKDDYSRNKDSYQALALPNGWEFRVTTGVKMGDKVREVFPEIKNNWVGLLNDDHFIKTENWDTKLLAKLDGKNFVNSNDNWRCPTLPTTATLWSMPLLDCVGWPIYPPGLEHLYIDNVWHELGKVTGCWRPVMSVIVEHHHVLNGRMEQDDTFHKVYDDHFNGKSRDQSVYELFMKHDFQATAQKIIAFQNNLTGQRYKPLNFKHDFVPTSTNMD